jgi:hypothetical protein
MVHRIVHFEDGPWLSPENPFQLFTGRSNGQDRYLRNLLKVVLEDLVQQDGHVDFVIGVDSGGFRSRNAT